MLSEPWWFISDLLSNGSIKSYVISDTIVTTSLLDFYDVTCFHSQRNIPYRRLRGDKELRGKWAFLATCPYSLQLSPDWMPLKVNHPISHLFSSCCCISCNIVVAQGQVSQSIMPFWMKCLAYLPKTLTICAQVSMNSIGVILIRCPCRCFLC